MRNLHVEYWQGRIDSQNELIKEAHGKIWDAKEDLRKNRFEEAKENMILALQILDEAWD